MRQMLSMLPPSFYWHNALMYNPFLNKNAGNTFRYYIIKNFLISIPKESGAGNMRQVK